ncbi:triphosphoribosyl-dephospho-CoA synthase [Rhodopirellula bahusiensis]|uniref:Triphosphoribosyl-dephospho-CoA synthase n=1 Tax=Rhodopirellula bahusiensis TaxID=2014065 RepID=A0A2G1W1C0_9BACT|nr:triphosphoribosyl-dephospho-CoA synthase [Rhodopirellula bahusiensis]PHQ32785.1 triphosphoribosyl-dephospho-CoA synthase [Rhodopirellula bahusiensis]
MRHDPWQWIAKTVGGPVDAIQYACVLEATAPKAGNVHPVAKFNDLCFADFVASAEIVASGLTATPMGLGDRIESVIRQTRVTTNTNVNLGIALLLGPIVLAEETQRPADAAWTLDRWREATANVLSTLSDEQSHRIGRAISKASAGGMDGDYQPGDPSLDVLASSESFDVMAGMRDAKDRDLIAAEYAGGFESFFAEVVPAVEASVGETGDLLSGIALAHLRLLADRGDSLIARKNGRDTEQEIRDRAKQCLNAFASNGDFGSIAEFDAHLRSEGHLFNPGTTADFIAAAVYVCLRTRA